MVVYSFAYHTHYDMFRPLIMATFGQCHHIKGVNKIRI